MPNRPSRPHIVPQPRTATPAGDYLALTSDAITLMRYARAAVVAARAAAPDDETAAALDKTVANCKDGMTSLTRARHYAQSRYARDGRPKPERSPIHA